MIGPVHISGKIQAITLQDLSLAIPSEVAAAKSRRDALPAADREGRKMKGAEFDNRSWRTRTQNTVRNLATLVILGRLSLVSVKLKEYGTLIYRLGAS